MSTLHGYFESVAFSMHFAVLSTRERNENLAS